FGVEVLATTDDPADGLAAHAALAADADWGGRVVPAFRPDRYLEPDRPDWVADVARLAAAADIDTGHYDGFVRALQARRHAFIAHGATTTDHGHVDVTTINLDVAEATR